MMRCGIQILIWMLLSFSAMSVAAGEVDSRQAEQCLACHMSEVPAEQSLAPRLGGLGQSYIADQLRSFQAGHRGDSEQGRAMAAALSGLDAADFQNLAAWADSLASKAVFQPDRAQKLPGHALYQDKCAGCHDSALGRMFTGSPVLGGLDADYLVRQLKDFQSGSRVIPAASKHQQKMVQLIQGLDDEQFGSVIEFIKVAAKEDG